MRTHRGMLQFLPSWALRPPRRPGVRKRHPTIARQLLGKYRDLLPPGTTSTEFLKEQRATLHGKLA